MRRIRDISYNELDSLLSIINTQSLSFDLYAEIVTDLYTYKVHQLAIDAILVIVKTVKEGDTSKLLEYALVIKDNFDEQVSHEIADLKKYTDRDSELIACVDDYIYRLAVSNVIHRELFKA